MGTSLHLYTKIWGQVYIHFIYKIIYIYIYIKYGDNLSGLIDITDGHQSLIA
jgi:hypothetical protein